MTQSRQVQLFGFSGAFILIFFIVIFLGKDFYKLYQQVSMPDSTIADRLETKKVIEKDLHEVETLVKEVPLHAVTTKPKTNPLPEKKEEHHEAKADVAVVPSVPVETVVVQKHQESSTQQATAPSISQTATHTVKNTLIVKTDGDIRQLNRQIHAKLLANGVMAKGMRLDPKEKVVLREIAERLQTLPFTYSVVVEGHTSAGHSKKETQLMAKHTASFLQKILPGVEMTHVGYGTLYPISDDLKDPVNRRIEIIVRRSDR